MSSSNELQTLCDEFDALENIHMVQFSCKNKLKLCNQAKQALLTSGSFDNLNGLKKALNTIRKSLKNAPEYIKRYHALKRALENDNAYTEDQKAHKSVYMSELESKVKRDETTGDVVPRFMNMKQIEMVENKIPDNIRHPAMEEEEEEEEEDVQEEEEDHVIPMVVETPASQELDRLEPLFEWSVRQVQKMSDSDPKRERYIRANTMRNKAARTRKKCMDENKPFNEDITELLAMFVEIESDKKEAERPKPTPEKPTKALKQSVLKKKPVSKKRTKKQRCWYCEQDTGRKSFPPVLPHVGYCHTHYKENALGVPVQNFITDVISSSDALNDEVKRALVTMNEQYDNIVKNKKKRTCFKEHGTAAGIIFKFVHPDIRSIADYFIAHSDEFENYKSTAVEDDDDDEEQESVDDRDEPSISDVVPDDAPIVYEPGIKDQDQREDDQDDMDFYEGFSSSSESSESQEDDSPEIDPLDMKLDDMDAEDQEDDVGHVCGTIEPKVRTPNKKKRSRSDDTDESQLMQDFVRISKDMTDRERNEFLALMRQGFWAQASEFMYQTQRKRTKYRVVGEDNGISFYFEPLYADMQEGYEFINGSAISQSCKLRLEPIRLSE